MTKARVMIMTVITQATEMVMLMETEMEMETEMAPAITPATETARHGKETATKIMVLSAKKAASLHKMSKTRQEMIASRKMNAKGAGEKKMSLNAKMTLKKK